MTGHVLIKACDLTKLHHTPGGVVRAIDEIDRKIGRGETLGLVGESGCGKFTLGWALTRLREADQGSIRYDEKNIAHLNRPESRPLRDKLQMAFQDPFVSLNPCRSIRQILTEPFSIHGIGNCKERWQIIDLLIDKVGLHSDLSEYYPHDLSVIGYKANRIAVMYLSEIIEETRHRPHCGKNRFIPIRRRYSRRLPNSIRPVSRGARECPSRVSFPAPSNFRPFRMPIFAKQKPDLKEPANRSGMRVSCHLNTA